MKREKISWGLVFVLILIVLSILLLILPCKPHYVAGGFFGAGCINQTFFLILNFPGVILIRLIAQTTQITESIPLSLLTILLSSIFYFLLGAFVRNLVVGDKK